MRVVDIASPGFTVWLTCASTDRILERMIREKTDGLADVRLAESQTEPERIKPGVDQARDAVPVVRYMDEETFQRSLERVSALHERLLSKLAE